MSARQRQSVSPSRSQSAHVHSSPGTFTSKQETQSATKKIITRRKTWKTLKENNEAVWPPHVESALIEALEKYRPSTNRDTRLLLRFPKRNRWISEYVFRVTGKHRTAKQVGSRLQQLRDTCSESRILNLLSRREYSAEPQAADEDSPEDTGGSSSSSPSNCDAVSPLASSELSHAQTTPSPPPRRYVTIEFASQLSSRVTGDSFSEQSQRIALQAPQPMYTVVPNVTFLSTTSISTSNHISRFRVFIGEVEMHCEHTNLVLLSTSKSTSSMTSYLYGSPFLPSSWPHLCRRPDFSQCVVEQDILKMPVEPNSPTPRSTTILSVVYNFSLSPLVSPMPPPLLDHSAWDNSHSVHQPLSQQFLQTQPVYDNTLPHFPEPFNHSWPQPSSSSAQTFVKREEYNWNPPSELDFGQPSSLGVEVMDLSYYQSPALDWHQDVTLGTVGTHRFYPGHGYSG